MQLDKQTIIDELERQGKSEAVAEAERTLPGEVHLGNHAVQLQNLGLDPQDLANRFPPAGQ